MRRDDVRRQYKFFTNIELTISTEKFISQNRLPETSGSSEVVKRAGLKSTEFNEQDELERYPVS